MTLKAVAPLDSNPYNDVAMSAQVRAVDTAWMTGALSQSYDGLEVTSCKILDVIQGMSVKIRVALEYNSVGQDIGLPPSMVVKGAFQRHENDYWNYYFAVEMHSYRDVVVPTLKDVRTPKIFFAGNYPSEAEPITIMEDLVPAKVRFNDVLTPINYNQVADSLDQQARYHAAWWNSPKLQDPAFDWMEHVRGGEVLKYYHWVLEPHIWDQYMKLPRAAGLPKRLKDADAVRRSWDSMRQIHLLSSNQTIVHTDHHVGNTYVTADGRSGLLDWQIRRGCWHHDVSYFIVSALDVSDRRNWEMALLQHYLGRLAAYGVEPPPFEEAWLMYRRDMLHGLVTWMVNGDDQGQYQRECINAGNATRFGFAAMDHGILDLG